MVTRTINQIHFEDLDPIRFEELVLCMVWRMKRWAKIDHFGKMGSDGGIDIRAIEKVDENVENVYCFQCKRYMKLTNNQLKKILDDFVLKNNFVPQVYILVVACSLRREQIEFFDQYSKKSGFKSVVIWTKTVLESMLYSDYKDLLLGFFGVNLISDGTNIALKKCDYLKNYYDYLREKIESLEFHGKPEYTTNCVRELFISSLHIFGFIKKEHKKNSYLFSFEENEIIEGRITEINEMINNYNDEYRNNVSNYEKYYADMDDIAVKVYYFYNSYIDEIKLTISKLLLN